MNSKYQDTNLTQLKILKGEKENAETRSNN